MFLSVPGKPKALFQIYHIYSDSNFKQLRKQDVDCKPDWLAAPGDPVEDIPPAVSPAPEEGRAGLQVVEEGRGGPSSLGMGQSHSDQR